MARGAGTARSTSLACHVRAGRLTPLFSPALLVLNRFFIFLRISVRMRLLQCTFISPSNEQTLIHAKLLVHSKLQLRTKETGKEK